MPVPCRKPSPEFFLPESAISFIRGRYSRAGPRCAVSR